MAAIFENIETKNLRDKFRKRLALSKTRLFHGMGFCQFSYADISSHFFRLRLDLFRFHATA
jgi:hypothetical protein